MKGLTPWKHRPESIHQSHIGISMTDRAHPLAGIGGTQEQAGGLEDRTLARVVGANDQAHRRQAVQFETGDATVSMQCETLKYLSHLPLLHAEQISLADGRSCLRRLRGGGWFLLSLFGSLFAGGQGCLLFEGTLGVQLQEAGQYRFTG